MRTCVCQFDPPADLDPTSSAFHRAHKDHHLTRYPNVGIETIQNLETLVVLAESGELKAEQGWS